MVDDVGVPESHPRHDQLLTRQRIEAGIEQGLTHQQGLIAHGRGEALDYLIGERTIQSADEAAKAAAARLLVADHPVLSVNGNVAALVPGEMVELATVVDAVLEINLFHRSADRIHAISDHLIDHGADRVLGQSADATIPGINHDRGQVASDGIGMADVVLVPLEDGDRTAALAEAGISPIVIDLNPLSRSSMAAEIPIVDNVIRAIPTITDHATALTEEDTAMLQSIIAEFNPIAHRRDGERAIRHGNLSGLEGS